MMTVLMLAAMCVMTSTKADRDAAAKAFRPYERVIGWIAAGLWIMLLYEPILDWISGK